MIEDLPQALQMYTYHKPTCESEKEKRDQVEREEKRVHDFLATLHRGRRYAELTNGMVSQTPFVVPMSTAEKNVPSALLLPYFPGCGEESQHWRPIFSHPPRRQERLLERGVPASVLSRTRGTSGRCPLPTAQRGLIAHKRSGGPTHFSRMSVHVGHDD